MSSPSEVQKEEINTPRSQTQGESASVTGASECTHMNKNAERAILLASFF